MGNKELGWFKHYKCGLDWEWFDNSRMVHLWDYILMSVNYEDKEWKKIKIEKGSFITSIKQISAKTKISEKTIRTLLKKLEKTGEIEVKTTNKYTVIKALKWDYYQGTENEKGKQSNEQSNEQSSDISSDISYTLIPYNKEYKEIKEVKNNIYVQEFETLWKKYPRKQGKQKALNSYQKSRKKYTYEQIETGLNNYIFYISENKIETKYVKNGSSWFNQECWNDDWTVYKNSQGSKDIVSTERIMNLEIYDN